ncbi:hypothetical protein WJX77_004573 [Trebouxia sp. C0004]
MVNLVCQAHGLSLLIKDLLKHVGGEADGIYGKIYQICSQVETRFGTKVMVCRDVLRLQAAVMDAAYNHADEGQRKSVIISPTSLLWCP